MPPPVPPSGSELPAALPPLPAIIGAGAAGAAVPPGAPAPRSVRGLRRGEWRLLWLIVGLFILRDLPWRLEEYDQAKQAFTSLEMVQAGHWGFQHAPGGQSLAGRPPLVGWMSAGLYYLTGGNWDLAWRLPSLLAALLLLALLWRAGEKTWPGWGGTLAAAAFALNQFTPRLATLVQTGPPLTLWVTLLGLIVWRHAGGDGGTGDAARPWAAGARGSLPFLDPARHRWLAALSLDRWAVFFLLVAAVMTAGPVVYALLLPGMAAHTLILRRRAKTPGANAADAAVAPDIWGGWWHWALPLLPFLFWLERGMVTVPGFTQQVVMSEFMGRSPAITGAVPPGQPIYFYFAQLLGGWAPWSILLLAVRLRGPNVWWSLWRDPRNLWLVCWAAGGLLVLTLLPAKSADRIFPVLPPLCLLMVAALRRAEEAGSVRREDAAEGMLPGLPPGSLPAPAQAVRVPAAWPRAWSYLTLRLGIVTAVVGSVYGAGRAFWQREDAGSRFGAQVRAATAGRRVELVASGGLEADETMLVYLRRLEFRTPVQALQLWSTGRVDALVFSGAALEKSRGLLEPALPLDHPTLSLPNQGGQAAYTFVVRDSDTPPLTVPPRSPNTEDAPPVHRHAAHKKKP